MDVHQVIILDEYDKKSSVPDVPEFENHCRVCLAVIKSPSSGSKSIHEEESRMSIRSLLEVYTYVKIPEYQDILPQKMCRNCVDFLIEIHTFRCRAKVNDDLLHKIHNRHLNKDNVQNSVSNVEIEDDFIENETQIIINKINDERMGIFRCKDCPEIYDNIAALIKHRKIKNHSRKPASACPHCGKMFNSTALVQHVRTHTKEKPFMCNVCHASFAVKNNLRRHMKIHSDERAFTCEVCGKSFIRSESLAMHLKKHEEEKCKQEKIKSGVFEDETEDMEDEAGFQCSDCDKVYKSEEQLKMHARYHKQKFLCNDCGKVFATKANLITHIRVHTGEKPYVCSECNKGFSQSSSLRIHMSVHDGSKAYSCEFCDRKFSVKGNLNAHKRIHTGSTPHRCEICDKGFCTSSTLRKHMRGHAKKEMQDEGSGDDNSQPSKDEGDSEKPIKYPGKRRYKKKKLENITPEDSNEEEVYLETDEIVDEDEEQDKPHFIVGIPEAQGIVEEEEEVYVINDDEEIVIEEYQEGDEVYFEEEEQIEYMEEEEHSQDDDNDNTVQECKVHIPEEEDDADVIVIGPKKFNLHITP